MRLLNTETLEVKEFLVDIPTYAILSHTWEKEEVVLKDIQNCQKLQDIQGYRTFEEAKDRAGWKKAGWSKIWNACKYAKRYKFEWIWIDTCCIDKSSSAELSEALNSMYKYYGEGRVCIAYLSDVSNGKSMAGLEQFKKSRWFERGWTLQELIAPRHMVFLDQDWNMIGTRYSMRHIVSEVTSIPVMLFEGQSGGHGGELEDYSIAQRMSWAASRRTTREEDMAYCLMGLFGMNMPPIYGEGGAKAFMRLQLEIIKYSDDRSIFAWVALEDYRRDRGLLASSPSEFASSGKIFQSDSEDLGEKSSFSFDNNGLRIHLHLQPLPDIEKDLFFASLHCRNANGVVGIYLRKNGHRYVRWFPRFPLHQTYKPMGNLQEVVVKESAIPPHWPEAKEIPIEFELDSEFTLLGQIYTDGTLHSIQSFLLGFNSITTFRLKTKNGNEFDIRLLHRSYDVIPREMGRDHPLQDSRQLPIDDGNGLASCFVYKPGDSANQSNIEINYIPSSSPEFEFHRHINKFRYTSHAPSSAALNFKLGTNPFSQFSFHRSFYPSDAIWKPVGYVSIPDPGNNCDIHYVLKYGLSDVSKAIFMTLGLRTVSEGRIPWIDICVLDYEVPISDVWQSYQHPGSRYNHRKQSRSTAALADSGPITVSVEEKTMLDAPLYHVVWSLGSRRKSNQR